MRNKVHDRAILILLCGWLGAAPAYAVSDNFSNNPLTAGSPWSFGVGGNASNQFSWSPGALSVHLNSSLPTARLDRPLGTTLTDSTSFLVTARFSFSVTHSPAEQTAQFAFGLTNHALTGGDRTGTLANFLSDNTYDTFEFNYFPNASPTFGGPDLTPAIFGGPDGGQAFDNFAPTVFEPFDLGHHAQGITALPQSTTLEAHVAYDGANQLVTLSMYQVAGNGSLTLLDTELPQVDLRNVAESGYNPQFPFKLDTLSIMAYHDGFTTADDPSLIGDITYQNISLTVVPEPSTALLAMLAGLLLIPLCRRVRRGRRDRLRS